MPPPESRKNARPVQENHRRIERTQNIMTKEQAKQRAEIMLAWANGETIQYRNKRENKWLDSDVDGGLEFNWLDFEYTIKPKWELANHIPGFRPLRDGEEWQGVKWTQEALPNGWRPMLLGEIVETGDVLVCSMGGQQEVISLVGTVINNSYYNVKTRRPLPEPKPKLKIVPLEVWDIPPGSVFRLPQAALIWEASCKIANEAVYLFSNGWTSYFKLMRDGWEILRPGSTTWEKCEKIVEEKGEA